MALPARKLVYLLVANAGVFLVAFALIEAGGRIFLALRPSYDVVFLEPDRRVGWKHLPNNRFTWAGVGWYAREFSVPIEVNSHGFRDHDRAVAKPPGVRRLALLGDSFVEAQQVPIAKTAGQLLEVRLNRDDPKWEVLNFGVSNYGVGQYLLVWESYVREFAPDYVVVFVADHIMRRTVKRYEVGAFRTTRDRALWVRPTFRVRGNRLIREPARDFQEFERAQKMLIETEFGGQRSRIRERSFLGRYLRPWFSDPPAASRPVPKSGHSAREIRRINLRVLKELASQIRRAGSRLAIVDASRYFRRGDSVTEKALEKFTAREGIGYLPLSAPLLHAVRSGHATRWRYDGHFNALANEIFASVLDDWLMEQEAERGARAAAEDLGQRRR